MSGLRLLLVDENDDVLDALAAWLDGRPGLSVVGRAHSAAEAVRKSEELLPNVVVMDLSLPGASGLHATRQIKADLNPPIVILTAFHSSEAVRAAALAAGADACLPKSEVTDLLLSAIEEQAENQILRRKS